MLIIIILQIVFLVPGIFSFYQNDYLITFERGDVYRYNKEYFQTAKIVTFKYNRTQTAWNATLVFLKDLGYDIELVLQAYTFLSNEYRLFPIRFSLNFCKSIKSDDFGLADIVQEGFFSGCPIKKGTLNVHNWKPNPSKFPPRVPNGQYKIEVQLLYFSSEILVVNAYGTVHRPLGRRH